MVEKRGRDYVKRADEKKHEGSLDGGKRKRRVASSPQSVCSRIRTSVTYDDHVSASTILGLFTDYDDDRDT